jgi:hypothetical protein
MKKGTRTWKLWWMFGIHLLAMMGITGLYAEFVVNYEVNGFIQLVATVVLITSLAVLMSNAIKLLTRILKRKQLW